MLRVKIEKEVGAEVLPKSHALFCRKTANVFGANKKAGGSFFILLREEIW